MRDRWDPTGHVGGRTPAIENTWPTAEQWLDWLLDQPRETQIAAVDRAIASRQDAVRCLEQNHAGLLDELTAAREAAAREYQRGVDDLAAAIRGAK